MESLSLSEKSSGSNDSRSLSEIFETGLALFTSILETKEATNSFKVQVNCRIYLNEFATVS